VGGGIRSRGGKGEEEEHGAEPKVPTPDDGKGREGKGREENSVRWTCQQTPFPVLVLGQNPNGLS